MSLHEIEPLLREIRALVLELRQLEGDGADEISLTRRRHELAQVRSALAEVVSRDPRRGYDAAA